MYKGSLFSGRKTHDSPTTKKDSLCRSNQLSVPTERTIPQGEIPMLDRLIISSAVQPLSTSRQEVIYQRSGS